MRLWMIWDTLVPTIPVANGAVINIPQQIPYEYGDIPKPAQGKTCMVSKINIDYPGEW
jgi:hypothetical protein